jgi:hypothetical protein
MRIRYWDAYRVLVCAMALATVSAQGQNLIGHGSSTCLNYSASREMNSQVHSAFLTWAVGYLSGVNVIAANALNAPDFLATAKAQDIATFLDMYCAKYPEKQFSNAVNAYYFAARRE